MAMQKKTQKRRQDPKLNPEGPHKAVFDMEDDKLLTVKEVVLWEM